MSAQTHYVTLVAKDQVSQTFLAIGRSAQTAATQISANFRNAATGLTQTDAAADNLVGSFTQVDAAADRMGASIETAARDSGVALDKTGQSAEKAAESFDRAGKLATQIGAGIGTAVGVIASLGAAAEGNRRQIVGLDAAYGEASQQVQEFAKELQHSTNFSDEAGRQAAITASTLSRNYGISADQIEELVARSADLAQVYGTDLEDAVQRTSSAIRGEAESAEALGLTLSDTFLAAEAARRGMEGWTTSMTESEKAQFRLQILLEQTTYAQGQAAAASEGLRGKFIDLQHGIQDAAVSAGQFIGPVGEVAAGLAPLSLALPAVGAGFGKLSEGMKSAAPQAKSLVGSLSGLVGGLNPVTLGFGAVAAAAGIAILAFQQHEEENRNLEASYKSLGDAIGEIEDRETRLTALMAQLNPDDLTHAYAQLTQEFLQANNQLGAYTLDAAEAATVNALMEQSFEAAGDDVRRVAIELNELSVMHKAGVLSGAALTTVLTNLNGALAYTGAGYTKVHEEAFRLLDVINQGGPAAQQAINDLGRLAANAAEFGSQSASATPRVTDLGQAIADTYGAINQRGLPSDQLRQLREDILETKAVLASANLREDLQNLGAGFEGNFSPIAAKHDEEIAAQARATAQELVDIQTKAKEEEERLAQESRDAVFQAQEEKRQAAEEYANTLRNALIPALEGASGAFADLVQPGEDFFDVMDRLGQGGVINAVTDSVNDATSALESFLGMLSGLDRVKSAVGEAAGIADELLGGNRFEDRANRPRGGEGGAPGGGRNAAANAARQAQREVVAAHRESGEQIVQIEDRIAAARRAYHLEDIEATREIHRLNQEVYNTNRRAEQGKISEAEQAQKLRELHRDIVASRREEVQAAEELRRIQAEGQQGIQDAMAGADRVSGKAQADAQREVTAATRETRGELTLLERLLRSGKISQEEFNAASLAGVQIQHDQAVIGKEIAGIQAQQLPQLAEATSLTRDQVAAIGDLNTEEQQRALYLLDTDNQMKLTNATSLIYAANLGEIPKDVATDIILGTARADPVLADLLDQYGLIERGAKGEIEVTAITDDATKKLDDLQNDIETLDGPPPIKIVTDEQKLTSAVSAVNKELGTITAKPHTVVITGENGGLRQVVATSKTLIDTLVQAPYEAKLGVDPSAFNTQLKIAQAELTAFDGSQYTANLEADMGDSSQGAAKGSLLGVLATAYDALGLYADPNNPWVTTLEADNAQAMRAIGDVTTGLDAIATFNAAIAVHANTGPFWKTVRGINGDTVGKAFIELESTGVESVGASSASAASRSALLTMSQFVDSPSGPSAPLPAIRSAPTNPGRQTTVIDQRQYFLAPVTTVQRTDYRNQLNRSRATRDR